MSLDSVLKAVQIGAYLAGAISAGGALWVYRSNARRERARWVENLYSRFYENESHKKLREKLDREDVGSAEISKLVSEEEPPWTDYLNFFELVAYLQKVKQVKQEDVDAVFRYPLRCIKKHPEVTSYIRDPRNDYQNLVDKLSEDE